MSDQTSQAIEEKKLEFEREKLALEHTWRRNTYRWSIASAFLSAAVTVGVAFIASGGSSSKVASPAIAKGPVQACRDSLRRLETLSGAVATQTVTDLMDAIRLHKDQCDDVLVGILSELDK